MIATRLLSTQALLWTAWLPVFSLAWIVIRHDRPDSSYRELARSFPAAVDVGADGGGVLVAPRWVLTAGHVVAGLGPFDARVTLGTELHSEGGRSVAIDRVILHPEFRTVDTPENDIALVRLAEAVTDVEPATLHGEADELGREVVLVGNGGFGTGETGAIKEDRLRRGATNRVERIRERTLHFRFDDPDGGTDFEGFWGPGDSGTPVFLAGGGAQRVIGVASYGGDSNESGKHPDYGDRDVSFRVSHYAPWLRETMAANAEGPADWSKAVRLAPDQPLEEGVATLLAEYRDARGSRDVETRGFFISGRFDADSPAADPDNAVARSAVWRDEELPILLSDTLVVGYAECRNGGAAVLLATPAIDEHLALTFVAGAGEPGRLTEVRLSPVPQRFFE